MTNPTPFYTVIEQPNDFSIVSQNTSRAHSVSFSKADGWTRQLVEEAIRKLLEARP